MRPCMVIWVVTELNTPSARIEVHDLDGGPRHVLGPLCLRWQVDDGVHAESSRERLCLHMSTPSCRLAKSSTVRPEIDLHKGREIIAVRLEKGYATLAIQEVLRSAVTLKLVRECSEQASAVGFHSLAKETA